MNTTKQINVTVTEYEGDVAFPEAAHYPEYVSAALAGSYPGFAVNVSTGPRTTAHVYGADIEPPRDLEHEIESLVKVDLWDAFCADGYKRFAGG
jgi:hypothetical protein